MWQCEWGHPHPGQQGLQVAWPWLGGRNTQRSHSALAADKALGSVHAIQPSFLANLCRNGKSPAVEFDRLQLSPSSAFSQLVILSNKLLLFNLSECKTHLFIFPETSLSFIKHSIFSGRSVLLELISFFNFSHSWYRRRSARILDFASSLYLVLNSAQKCSTNFASKFFPPKKGSKAVPST